MVDTGQVRLHVVTAGEGPAVLLLHGFPSNSQGWRHQVRPLVEAGYRVVAPDLRGFHLSEKPHGVANYESGCLVGDVVGLLNAMGVREASVVGHDWGAIVAWCVAGAFPDLVRRLVVLNGPHPRMLAHQFRSIQTLRRMWPFLVFQVPFLGERLASCPRFIEASLRANPRLAAQTGFTDAEVEGFVNAMRKPRAGISAVNHFRAALRTPPRLTRPIRVPTLIVWGLQDRMLDSEMLDAHRSVVDPLSIVRLDDAGHWPHVESPVAVNAALVDFLRSS